MVDGCDRFRLVAARVKLAHPHAAEADRRHFGAIAAEPPFADLEHVHLLQSQARRETCSSNNLRSRRTCTGLRPRIAEKQRFMWLWSQKPAATAISASGKP